MSDPEPASARPPAEVAGRVGKYDIIGHIASGAMGAVYRAHDPQLRREVAVKVMLAESANDSEAKARFQREAVIVAKMSHRNIVTVLDFGYHNDCPFIVMELLHGRLLKQAMQQSPSLTFSQRITVVCKILAGLARAHEAGVVHRDIKPRNIFMTDDGDVKILDFGVARLTGASMTGSGLTLGTPYYMSPEQWTAASTVDGRSDLFSVGVLLYEMLAGTVPFLGVSWPDTMYKILHEAPDFEPIRPHPALIPILEKALAKEVLARYQSAGDLASALQATTYGAAKGTSMPEMLRTACPHCNLILTVNVKFVGRNWPCGHCGEMFEIPPFADEPLPARDLVAGDDIFANQAADVTLATTATVSTPESMTVELASSSRPQEGAKTQRAGPDSGLVAGTRSTAADTDFRTDAINEDGIENGETEIRSMLEHLPSSIESTGPPAKQEILRSFLGLKWQELARRDFFASVPTFAAKLQEVAPLLSPSIAKQLPKRLDEVERKWDEGRKRIAKGEKVFAAHQGLPQLASVCLAVSYDFMRSGDHEFVLPLADVAMSALFLADVAKTSDDFLQAFRLRTLAELIRKHSINFDAVLGDVRRATQGVRNMAMHKKIAPRLEDLSHITCKIIYEYYTTILNQATEKQDRSRAQEIVPSALCYVCRQLAEEGEWKQFREWIALCSRVDSDAVDGAREMGLIVDGDPLESPPKSTQTDVMLLLQNRDLAGAIAALEPWYATVRHRLQTALRLFLDYRIPESNYLTVHGQAAPPTIVRGLQTAVELFSKGDLNAAIGQLSLLPAIGAFGIHPLVREWRALVNARLGARHPAEILLRQSLTSGVVLEDTVWNLVVLLTSDGTATSQGAAFEALREYLNNKLVTIYDGGVETEKSGTHIVGNTATTLTLIGLALSLDQEQFVIDFVCDTPRNQLRLYTRLLPVAFLLAARINHSRLNELRDSLIGQWTGGGHVQWADPEKRVAEAEIQSYINDTGGDPIALRKLADYLEVRVRYHKQSWVLHQYLADIYQTLELPERELAERCQAVMVLARTARVSDAELRPLVDAAIRTAEDNRAPREKLDALLKLVTRIGKNHWLVKWRSFLGSGIDDRAERVPKVADSPSEASESLEYNPTVPSRTNLADAVRAAQVDAEVGIEIVTDALVNDVEESDLVVRIANMRPVALTNVELYLEFDQLSVHAGSGPAPLLGPHGLKERPANSVTYETIAVYCPRDVKGSTVTAALFYTADGQRRYREAARPTLSGRTFATVTGRNDGVPHDLYCYGGMVSGAYAHTFKGREKLRETLLERTYSGNMTHFLDGIKRVGKSSICANLVYDPPPKIVAVHLDLERYALGDEKTTTVRFCQHLLSDIGACLESHGYGRPELVPSERWQSEPATLVFLDALREIAARITPVRLLMMFDEVQALLASVENNQRLKDADKYVRKDFLDMLSAMLNDADRPGQLLFTASERFETVKSGGYYNLFNRLTPINLSFLDAAATSDILSAGVRGTNLRYVPEATAAVWQYLRGYPAHVQQMGDKLMEKLRVRHRSMVLPQDVAEVAEVMIGDSVLFDYQCNRDTIRRDEVSLLEAIFKGQEQIYGRRSGIGCGVPVRNLVVYAPGLESARIPMVIKALKNQQVIAEERDKDGQLLVRINGLLMEMWLSRLRDERGTLREEAFPSKRASILDLSQSLPSSSTERRGCAVWIDFENVVRSDALRAQFLGDVDSKSATEDFVGRLLKACSDFGLDLRDKRVVAPWSIDELLPYQDLFEVLGFKPINCLKGVKNAADFVIAQELVEKLPMYSVAGVGTLLLITADNDLATTITRSKGAGLRTVAWGTWQGRPSRDINATADVANSLMEMMYQSKTTAGLRGTRL